MNRIICIVFSLALALSFMANTADAGPHKARAQSKSSVSAPSRNAGGNNKAYNNKGNNNKGNNNRGNNNKANANNGNRNNNNNKNVNRNNNKNVNRNTNVNIDRDIDVDIDVDHRGGYGRGGCCYHDNDYHPIAAAAAITATAIIVGSMVNSLPPSCSTVIVNGYAYQQCGNDWYQPQMSGSSTTYVVVNNPGY